jgi:dipeptidyl aminopeptidase/acylaminoacyl peptidase
MMQAKYGTWESPISAAMIASSGVTFSDIQADGAYIYTIEMRPNEKGRCVIVRYKEDGTREDILPAPFSARTRVHEYGGRSFTVYNNSVYFVNYADQYLYKFKVGDAPRLLNNSSIRFAELFVTAHGLLAVAEEHHTDGSEASNYIVLINTDNGNVKKLVSGSDFYAFPTVNSEGSKIAWVCWNHPNMPWDDTELWVADLDNGSIKNKQQIASDKNHVSHSQPRWYNGDLIFIDDSNNWWNPYRWNVAQDTITPIITLEADLAGPTWILGKYTWDIFKNQLLFIYSENGHAKIALVDPSKTIGSNVRFIDMPFTDMSYVYVHKDSIYFIGYSTTHAPALVKYNKASGIVILHESAVFDTPETTISVGKHIKFPTKSRQGVAYAYYYPPNNPEFTAPVGSLPPLIVIIHGGPTAATSRGFALAKQYWTSRGFAVADVNHGGSTGYGRKFRKALQRDSVLEPGYWGEIDINDCVACVEYLVKQNLVDPSKVVIRGGSAGGYTTLAALAFTNMFCAGANYYGVSDILALAKVTHKFESRYMDQLIGSLPEFEYLYRQRSPINNLDKFNAPLLVLQGDEDKIVPPDQSEMIVAALQQRGIRVEYKLYQGEQHGFRKADTIVDAHERELRFYLSVFDVNSP